MSDVKRVSFDNFYNVMLMFRESVARDAVVIGFMHMALQLYERCIELTF